MLPNITKKRWLSIFRHPDITTIWNSTRIFQKSPPFAGSACFYVTISGNFECFQYYNFETDFLENENLFQKPEALFFSCKH